VHVSNNSDPTSELIAIIGEIWCELIGIDEVGPDDRLLDIGGNSLIATMTGNRIELLEGVRPTMEVLMTSTLSELAAEYVRLRQAVAR
jgi:hypothetical protein